MEVVRQARSQADLVVQGVRDMIISRELQPGARLPIEQDLAARFAVSRNALREGVRALSHLGVLETRQGSGTYVTALDPGMLLAPVGFVADLHPGASVQEVQTVRRVLETAAVRLASLRVNAADLTAADAAIRRGAEALDDEPDYEAAMDADLAFHQVLAKASGNAVLASLIDALAGRTARARLWRALADERAATAAVEEHRGILVAVRAGDPEAAAVHMAAHLLSVEKFLARGNQLGPEA